MEAQKDRKYPRRSGKKGIEALSNVSRYRVRALPAAGALLRQEDTEERQLYLLESGTI